MRVWVVTKSKAGSEWGGPEELGRIGWRGLQFKAEAHRFLLWPWGATEGFDREGKMSGLVGNVSLGPE